MTIAGSGIGIKTGARPLRFLLLLFGGWMLVRVMAHWDLATPMPLPATLTPTATAPRAAMPVLGPITPDVSPLAAGVLPRWKSARSGIVSRSSRGPTVPRVLSDSPGSIHSAMIARLLPALPGDAARAVPATAWAASALPPSAGPPGTGQPYWMNRQLAGWSLGGWAYVRPGSGNAPPGGIAAASQLGGSQAGLRLAYGFGDSGRMRAYTRATLALAALRQRELAFGLAFAPVARLPIDVAVEQRVAAGSQGRTALAMMVSGGVGDVVLPQRFRLEAYGQAGVVGARRRDGFVDAAVVVDREILRGADASLHLGALAAGSVQPGASRVDVGPRLTLRLPNVGAGCRVALDWRQRVAGHARPDSGVALTLAADF